VNQRLALDPSLAWQLVRRNALYQRRAWAAVVTALVEPAVYFAAVVLGLSQIVDSRDPRSYALFAGPALMAVCAMNGAVVECTNNVFFRWKQGRLYESVLCTPLSAGDIVLGDLLFGTLRGGFYGTAFLLLLTAVTGRGLLSVLCCVVAATLIAWMFAAIGLVLVTMVRSWRQLQYVHLAFFVMFLSANTFVDVADGSPALRALTSVMPLTYANGLARACSDLDWPGMLLYAGVVSAIALPASVLAIRRLSRLLSA
jgi:lipooligosaccharide transport system permease protein